MTVEELKNANTKRVSVTYGNSIYEGYILEILPDTNQVKVDLYADRLTTFSVYADLTDIALLPD